MITRSIGGTAAAAIMLFVFGTAAARADDDSCWQFVYKTIEHSAAEQHAPYITYSESVNIVSDGHRFERASANITYRDDGLAYVDDDRWVHPFVSDFLEPGPPVLGPYGQNRRSAWLGLARKAGPLHVIASTHTPAQTRCVDRGDEIIDGRPIAHIEFPDAVLDEPALKAIWIDRMTLDVSRLVVSEWLAFYGQPGFSHDLTDFTIDLQHLGPYAVLRRVSWHYSYRVFSQQSTLDAEYLFSNYHFDTEPPMGILFATNSKK